MIDHVERGLRARCERFDALRQFYGREDWGAPRWPLPGWLRAVSYPHRRFGACEWSALFYQERRERWWRGRPILPCLPFFGQSSRVQRLDFRANGRVREAREHFVPLLHHVRARRRAALKK